MKRTNLAIVALTLFAASLTSVGAAQASTPQTTLVTCTDLASKLQVALKPGQANCPTGTAAAIWHAVSGVTSASTGTGQTSLRVCTSNAPTATYQNIRSTCPKFNTTTNYTREVTAPTTPAILAAEAIGYDGGLLFVAKPQTSDSPVSFFDLKNLTTGTTTRTAFAGPGIIYIPGLRPSTSYRFTITAVSVDGVAANSATSESFVTGSLNNAAPSTNTGITSFALNTINPAVTGIVDNTAHTVSLFLPAGIDDSNLVATFQLASGAHASVANVAQTSGTTSNNFTAPLVYTITAQDGLTHQNYAVTAYTYLAGTLGVQGYSPIATGLATSVQLGSIRAVFQDTNQNTWLADFQNGILKVTPDHTISTVMPRSTMASCSLDSGGPAINTTINYARGLSGDAQGNIYVDDSGSCSFNGGTAGYALYKIASDGTLTLVSGGNGYGFTDGPSNIAQLKGPRGMAVDSLGNIYIADKYSNRVREVDTAGNMTTVAGTGFNNDTGDGGAALSANVSYPYAVALDSSDNLLIAERYSGAIRKVDHTTGIITTIAGGGVGGCEPDNVPALGAAINLPGSITLDTAGDIFIAEQNCNVIRRIDHTTGVMTIVVGTGTSGFSDGGSATTSNLAYPYAVWVSPDGHSIVVGDSGNFVVRKFVLP